MLLLCNRTVSYCTSPASPRRQYLLYIGFQIIFLNFCLTSDPTERSCTIPFSLLPKNIDSLHYKTIKLLVRMCASAR